MYTASKSQQDLPSPVTCPRALRSRLQRKADPDLAVRSLFLSASTRVNGKNLPLGGAWVASSAKRLLLMSGS